MIPLGLLVSSFHLCTLSSILLILVFNLLFYCLYGFCSFHLQPWTAFKMATVPLLLHTDTFACFASLFQCLMFVFVLFSFIVGPALNGNRLSIPPLLWFRFLKVPRRKNHEGESVWLQNERGQLFPIGPSFLNMIPCHQEEKECVCQKVQNKPLRNSHLSLHPLAFQLCKKYIFYL